MPRAVTFSTTGKDECSRVAVALLSKGDNRCQSEPVSRDVAKAMPILRQERDRQTQVMTRKNRITTTSPPLQLPPCHYLLILEMKMVRGSGIIKQTQTDFPELPRADETSHSLPQDKPLNTGLFIPRVVCPVDGCVSPPLTVPTLSLSDKS